MSIEEDPVPTSDVQDLLSGLSSEDSELLRQRFGLFDTPKRTIEELAASNGLSSAEMKKRISAILLSLVGR